MQTLAVSLAGKVRVNSISPGWIDTAYRIYEGPDSIQQPVGRVGNPKDIANMVLFLCSEKAGFITGENICIDGGMTKQMIYHDDYGWKLEGNNRLYDQIRIGLDDVLNGNTRPANEALADIRSRRKEKNY